MISPLPHTVHKQVTLITTSLGWIVLFNDNLFLFSVIWSKKTNHKRLSQVQKCATTSVSHQANVQENTGLLLCGTLRKDATTVFVHMVNSQARCVSPGLEKRAELKREWQYLQTLAFYAETMWLLSDSHLVEIWELFQQIILPDCLYSCAASPLEATHSVNFSPAVRVYRCNSGEKKTENVLKGSNCNCA